MVSYYYVITSFLLIVDSLFHSNRRNVYSFEFIFMIPNLFFPTKEFRFREVFYCFRFWWKFDLILYKQAGTGPSRRHIQGSKIATGLQNFKVLVNFFLKSLNAERNWKGGPFGIFQPPFCCKTPKKLKGDPFVGNFFWKKSHSAEKKSKGGTLWSRPVLYVTRETFLVQFLGPTGTFWAKTLTKSHDYSRLFSRKAPPKNEDP